MTESGARDVVAAEQAGDGRIEGAEVTVYFDGSCPLCTLEIGHYASCRGGESIAFVDVSNPDAVTGRDLERKSAMERFHVRRSDGELLSGAAAFVQVWRSLPGWRWLARLASVPGAMAILEGGYRMFLPVRPHLSGLVSRLGGRPANPRDNG